MRLYWPKTEAPSILPAGEFTSKPPRLPQRTKEFLAAIISGMTAARASAIIFGT